MNVLQIVVSFDVREDRLLLTVHGETGSMKAWLTRRFTRLLAGALVEILGVQTKSAWPLAAGDENMLVELAHSQALSKIDLTQPPMERAPDPANVTEITVNEPWLAHRLQVVWEGKDTPHPKALKLAILPMDGPGFSFDLNNDLPHALVGMLSQACAKAEWSGSIELPQLGAAAPAAMLTDSRMMH